MMFKKNTLKPVREKSVQYIKRKTQCLKIFQNTKQNHNRFVTLVNSHQKTFSNLIFLFCSKTDLVAFQHVT